MAWDDILKNLESNQEKQEDQIEQNPKETIDSKEELYNKIQTTLDSYHILMELKDLGEDVSDALKIVYEETNELMILGKTKFYLSDEELQKMIPIAKDITNKHK